MVDKKEDEEIAEIKQQIQDVIAKNRDKIPPEATPMIEEALNKIVLEGQSIPEAMGLTPDMVEEIYKHGYHLFQSGKFKDALPIFYLLRRIDGIDPRFTFAIAACHHHMKNYDEAAGNYILCEALDKDNPYPYYHLHDCFKNLNQPELAFNSLIIARRLAGDHPQYAEMKTKVELEIERLKPEIKEFQEKQQSTAA